jgi:hypothetical protein
MREALAHIDATLRLFDPTLAVSKIQGKRPQTRSKLFAPGERSRLCREVLRDAVEPLSAEAILRQIAAARGIDMNDDRLRSELIARFLQTLHRLAESGAVARVGRGIGVLWTISGNGD